MRTSHDVSAGGQVMEKITAIVDDASENTEMLHWTGHLMDGAKEALRHGWETSAQFCSRLWQRIDLQEVFLRSLAILEILRQSFLYFLGFIKRQTLNLLEILICYPCVQWLSGKVGMNPEWFVISGVSVCILLITGFLMYKKRILRRGRLRERSLSLDLSNPAAARGARDRGFSLDLSASQIEQRARNRSRGYSLDFWNKNNRIQGREHSGSLDLLTTEEIFTDLHNPAQHGLAEARSSGRSSKRGSKLSPKAGNTKNIPVLTYFGPTETNLVYSTITPPPSWQEASRSLLPHDNRMKLQREIRLDLSTDNCFLCIKEPNSRHDQTMLPISQCSVHVKSPVIGGVLEIYVKDSPKEEWMEHTFDTGKNAAQFQIDLLAIQTFGAALHRMYQALELIHQGSMACEGREYVCHHEEVSEDVSQGKGIAWDDVMRALGSNIPSVRVALERLWWHHYSVSTLRLRARDRAKLKQRNGTSVGNGPGVGEMEGAVNKDGTEEESTKNHNDYIHLTMEYIRKRLLLGPIDFFRLFVPSLPDTSLPRNDSSTQRMEQLLRWRKRSARAAMLVQSYVKARIIVNKGWTLKRGLPTHYLTRRLAYDDNIDNSQRDASAKNEYYEATVSRDVLTFVQPNEHDSLKETEHWWQWRLNHYRRSVLSRYQAFTLVGHHIFKIPDDEDFPLHPKADPVLAIPSLRELIENNPDHEFFVSAVFPEASKVGFVTLYIRTLSPGIDAAFDINMVRYKHGSKAIRDKKLSMMLQLGSSETKPLAELLTVSMMAFLMKTATQGGDTPNSDFGPSDRSPFPLIPLASFAETQHFGGALQRDRHLPQNYVSFTAHIDAQDAPFNVLSRLVLSSLERGALAKNVFDMTYVLEANEEDERPERALCSMRSVHIHPNDVALPSIFVWGSHNRRRQPRRMRNTRTSFFSTVIGNISTFGERFRTTNIQSDGEVALDDHNALIAQYTPEDAQRRLRYNTTCVVSSDDPIEKAVNELVEILDSVRIPIRRDQLEYYEFATSVPMPLLEVYSSAVGELHSGDLMNMSVLLLVRRGDIKRHLIASGCDLKKAAIRIVESVAWYGQTFPIDTRICRIELQNGQFFQQGSDLNDRPVFYFRNMGRGPWRKNLDASTAAVLHRFDGALRHLAKNDECVQCTLIVIVGKPFRPKDRKRATVSDVISADGTDDELDNTTVMSGSFMEGNQDVYAEDEHLANPRVNSEEPWQLHTNEKLVKQLVDLVSAHYPERLYQALVVVNDNQILSLKRFMGPLTLSSFVDSNRTRSKVKFLSKFSELEKYVSKNELVTIAGGNQPIDPRAFELLHLHKNEI